jgi:hypothetical protein
VDANRAIAVRGERGFSCASLAYAASKMGRDMPNPNSYECKACGATFDSKEQLDGHNRREHSSGAMAGAGSGTGQKSGNSSTQKKNM